MTKTKMVILFLAVTTTLTLVLGQAAEKTLVIGTEIFDPYNVLNTGGIGQFISPPASLNCPGHEPTGNPMQPCPAGSRIQIRGLVFRDRVMTNNSLVTGNNTLEFNAAFDSDGTGQAWGTFSLAVDSGGLWEGTFRATRSFVEDENGVHWVSAVQFVGQGHGESLEGLVYKGELVHTSYTLMPFAYFGTSSGYIIDPHWKE
jgi:hypothetical protein